MIKGIYVHLPFCNNVCEYCDFTKGVFSENIKKRYIKALIKEIKNNKYDLSKVETIYLGGGTPTSLSSYLDELFLTLEEIVDISKIKEYTIEGNPDDITLDLLETLKRHKVSRISLGVESFNIKTLKLMRRNYDYNFVKSKIDLIKLYGFDVNIDMIYGYPFETIDDVRNNLELFLSLDIDHLSYYELIYEDKTILMKKLINKEYQKPDDDLVYNMHKIINATLTKNHFKRYEFSNYAKNKKESLHNLIYWDLDEYLGFGANSHSLVDNKRFYNEENIIKYIEKLENNEPYKIAEETDILIETFIMGLRKTKGINIKETEEKFNIKILEKYPMINTYIDMKLLKIKNGFLMLTYKGMNVSNQILQIFL